MEKIKGRTKQELFPGMKDAVSLNHGGNHEKENDQRRAGSKVCNCDNDNEAEGTPHCHTPGVCRAGYQYPTHWPDFLRAIAPVVGHAIINTLLADCGTWEVWLHFRDQDGGLRIKEITQDGEISRWELFRPQRNKKRRYKTIRSLLWRIHSGTKEVRLTTGSRTLSIIGAECIGNGILIRLA